MKKLKVISVRKGNSNKYRKIVVCPPKEKLEYYVIHLKLHSIFQKHEASKYVYGQIGRSVIENAYQHIGYDYTIKFDLKNFFDHVTHQRFSHLIPKEYVDKVFIRKIFKSNLNIDVKNSTTETVVLENYVAMQGLPTSPTMANLAFADTDVKLAELIKNKGVYTRYVDDLTFSFNDRSLFQELEEKVPKLVKKAGFLINHKKTKWYLASAGARIICNVGVYKNHIKPTRKTRRALRAATHQTLEYKQEGLTNWMNQIKNF